MPGPPYPDPGLVAVRNRRVPSHASSSTAAGKQEVTAALALVDRVTVDDFALLPFKGYAEPHDLTLTFDGVRPGVPQVLLLYGWVDYADSSSNLAASQAGIGAPAADSGGCRRRRVRGRNRPDGIPGGPAQDHGGAPPGHRGRERAAAQNPDQHAHLLGPDRACRGRRRSRSGVATRCPDGRVRFRRVSRTPSAARNPAHRVPLRNARGAGHLGCARGGIHQARGRAAPPRRDRRPLRHRPARR